MGWREERRKERHTVFPSWFSISVTLCKTESEINWVWEKMRKRKGSKQRGDEGRGSGAADVHTSVISKAWLMDMLLLTWAECLLYFCYCDECSFSMPLTRSPSQGHGVVLSNDKYSWIIDWPYPWNSLDTARESNVTQHSCSERGFSLICLHSASVFSAPERPTKSPAQ